MIDRADLESAAAAACRVGLRAGLRDPDARDLAQEALVRALTSAPPPPGVALPAWVYGIARNLARDHAKSAQRREVPMATPPEASATPAPRTEADVVDVLAVHRALDELAVELREVVTLHELEERTLRETAEILEIPFDTAKDRLRRARAHLRVSLGEPDRALAHERTDTRRRAAAGAAAITAALAGLLAVPAPVEAAPHVGALAAPSRRSTLAWTAGAALLVTVGFGLGRATAPATVPRVIPMIAAVPEAAPRGLGTAILAPTATSTSTEVRVARPDRAPSRPAVPTPTAAVAPSEPPRALPRDEVLLLDRARTAVARGLFHEAVVTLMSHARTYADGELAEERDVLLIEAYLGGGELDLARRRLARYWVDHPHGSLGARARALSDLAKHPDEAGLTK